MSCLLFTCNVFKKQYKGKTVDRFRLRWYNYKESNRKFLRGDEIKQKPLYEHFLKDGHHGFEGCFIVTLMLTFLLLGIINVSCNIKHNDLAEQNWTVKEVEQFDL